MIAREAHLATLVNAYWLAGYTLEDLERGLKRTKILTEAERARARIIFTANELNMRLAARRVADQGAEWDRRKS